MKPSPSALQMNPGTAKRIRPPAQAGRFYPGMPHMLEQEVCHMLAAARPPRLRPKAMILPHAGYPYSGPIAATGYRLFQDEAAEGGMIERILLLGPAHYVPVRGLAASGADAFATPLGEVRLDRRAIETLLELPQVQLNDAAHAPEHSLEVHLPFLQVALGRFALVPLVVGQATPLQVAEVIERLWDGAATRVIVSSDLSHFHDYATARALDRATAERILRLEGESLDGEDACGCRPISGLLEVARRRGLRPHLLDLRNSGDTAGDPSRVVGYGAFAFEEPLGGR